MNDLCIICLNGSFDDSSLVQKFKCPGQKDCVFLAHSDCIQTWYRDYSSECPICHAKFSRIETELMVITSEQDIVIQDVAVQDNVSEESNRAYLKWISIYLMCGFVGLVIFACIYAND